MSKVLAIDYGKKRCGFAISDEDQSIAFPLKTVDNQQIYQYIKNITENENIEKFVIGLPRNNTNDLFDLRMWEMEHQSKCSFLKLTGHDQAFS